MWSTTIETKERPAASANRCQGSMGEREREKEQKIH